MMQSSLEKFSENVDNNGTGEGQEEVRVWSDSNRPEGTHMSLTHHAHGPGISVQ